MDPIKFWQRVDTSAGTSACWPWQGCILNTGYGQVCVGGKSRNYAHRVAYELMVGSIPDGLVIDHLCRMPSCCNPAHMEPVTHRTNLLRGMGIPAQRARQTDCIRGHPLDGDNLYVKPNGARQCRTCARIQQARRRAARGE